MVRELSFSERRDWLRLIRTQNVGPVSFRDLINRYGDAGTALEELPYLIWVSQCVSDWPAFRK